MTEAKFKKKLARNIKAIRISRNMSQTELANTLGLPRQNINRLETGSVNPTAYFLKRLSDALGVNVDQFFD